MEHPGIAGTQGVAQLIHQLPRPVSSRSIKVLAPGRRIQVLKLSCGHGLIPIFVDHQDGEGLRASVEGSDSSPLAVQRRLLHVLEFAPRSYELTLHGARLRPPMAFQDPKRGGLGQGGWEHAGH